MGITANWEFCEWGCMWGEFGANFIWAGSASGAVFLDAFFIPRGSMHVDNFGKNVDNYVVVVDNYVDNFVAVSPVFIA